MAAQLWCSGCLGHSQRRSAATASALGISSTSPLIMRSYNCASFPGWCRPSCRHAHSRVLGCVRCVQGGCMHAFSSNLEEVLPVVPLPARHWNVSAAR